MTKACSAYLNEAMVTEWVTGRKLLYHGTTTMFDTFDLSKCREDLVAGFYGCGIFFSPSKIVARLYAFADRNTKLDPMVIQDLKAVNPGAGQFLETLYLFGNDAWKVLDTIGIEDFNTLLAGVDGNTLDTISEYIAGTKNVPESRGGFVNIFEQSTGAPDWLYNDLDTIGVDSSVYRPKVYSVKLHLDNVLVTDSSDEAERAQRMGFDGVVFCGANLVNDKPEIAVFDTRNIDIVKVEVLTDDDPDL